MLKSTALTRTVRLIDRNGRQLLGGMGEHAAQEDQLVVGLQRAGFAADGVEEHFAVVAECR